jgi:hypothetical protein
MILISACLFPIIGLGEEVGIYNHLSLFVVSLRLVCGEWWDDR